MPTAIARSDEPIGSREHEMIGVAGVFEQALRPGESTISERSGRYRQRAQGQAARELSSKPRLGHRLYARDRPLEMQPGSLAAKRHARCVGPFVARPRGRREKNGRTGMLGRKFFEDRMGSEVLPALPWSEWRSTIDTLHMWTQIVGKVRLAYAPMMNEWWQVPLYVTSRGLTTSPIPLGAHSFEISFDFIDHNLSIVTSQGGAKVLPLMPRSVKDFYSEFTSAMKALGIEVNIWTRPVEVKNPIPFEQDELHASYDPQFVRKFHHVLVAHRYGVEVVSSEVHRQSEPRSVLLGHLRPFGSALFGAGVGGDTARSHHACGVRRRADRMRVLARGRATRGSRLFLFLLTPNLRKLARVMCALPAAWWHDELREFVLLYDDVRKADSPTDALAQFFESTYEAAADLLGWNRSELERMPKLGG